MRPLLTRGYAREFVRAVNQIRTQVGLSPLSGPMELYESAPLVLYMTAAENIASAFAAARGARAAADAIEQRLLHPAGADTPTGHDRTETAYDGPRAPLAGRRAS
jgi:hypothetical protein